MVRLVFATAMGDGEHEFLMRPCNTDVLDVLARFDDNRLVENVPVPRRL